MKRVAFLFGVFLVVGCSGLDCSTEYVKTTNDVGQVDREIFTTISSDSGSVQIDTGRVLDFGLTLLSVIGGSSVAAAVPGVRKGFKAVLPVLDVVACNIGGAKNESNN